MQEPVKHKFYCPMRKAVNSQLKGLRLVPLRLYLKVPFILLLIWSLFLLRDPEKRVPRTQGYNFKGPR